MNTIIIHKILIHHLDFEHRECVFSDTFVDLNEVSLEYYDKKVEKAFQAGNLKEMVVGNFHHLILRSKNMIETDENFIRQSKITTQELYDLGCLIGEMPNCDLMFAYCKKDGQDYMVMIKLNYKIVPVTLIEEEDDQKLVRVAKKQMLPLAGAPIEEAILVNMETNQLFLIEKRFMIDGKNSFYLNEQYIKGEPKLTDRQRLNATSKAIEKMDDVYHVNEEEAVPLIKKAIIEHLEKSEPVVPFELVKEVLHNDMQASEECEEMLKDLGIDEQDTIAMDYQVIDKMSRCKIVLDTDVEITMNLEDYLGGFYLQKETQEDGTIQMKLNGIKEWVIK